MRKTMGRSFDYVSQAPKGAAINILKAMDQMIEMIIEQNVLRDLEDQITQFGPTTYSPSNGTSMYSALPALYNAQFHNNIKNIKAFQDQHS